MLTLSTLDPGGSKVKSTRRKGRGNGSGMGKTCGRGQKGAGARKSSHKGKLRFEGGQMPLQQRLPKRGFRMRNPKEVQIVNLKALEALQATEIDVAVLKENGLIRKSDILVKVLGFGEITKAITLKVNEISKSAQEAIEAKGGKVEIV